jgi:hypothetical protein
MSMLVNFIVSVLLCEQTFHILGLTAHREGQEESSFSQVSIEEEGALTKSSGAIQRIRPHCTASKRVGADSEQDTLCDLLLC